MKKGIAILIISIMGAAVFFSASLQAQPEKPDAIGFIHTVYFWVNEGTEKSDVQQLIQDCKTYLGAVKTVEKIEVGKPAGTPRDVVDNSYAVNCIVYFKDKAAHDTYQTAQKHLDFIERNKAIWKKVQVYDMIPE